nr:hypothetical protein [Mycobacterium sp. E3298]
MRTSRTVAAGVAATTALAVAVSGCGGKNSTPSTSKPGSSSSATSAQSSAPASSGPAQPSDYTGLLIQASDINAPIPFTATPPISNPNGQPGIATTFKDEDGSHVIKDTIQVLADPGAATNALNAAKGGHGYEHHDEMQQQRMGRHAVDDGHRAPRVVGGPLALSRRAPS